MFREGWGDFGGAAQLYVGLPREQRTGAIAASIVCAVLRADGRRLITPLLPGTFGLAATPRIVGDFTFREAICSTGTSGAVG